MAKAPDDELVRIVERELLRGLWDRAITPAKPSVRELARRIVEALPADK